MKKYKLGKRKENSELRTVELESDVCQRRYSVFDSNEAFGRAYKSVSFEMVKNFIFYE